MGLDINNLWTKKDSEHLECLLHRYEQVLEEAGDLRAQILRILNSRKTDYKHVIKSTERISEPTDKFLGSIDNWQLIIQSSNKWRATHKLKKKNLPVELEKISSGKDLLIRYHGEVMILGLPKIHSLFM